MRFAFPLLLLLLLTGCTAPRQLAEQRRIITDLSGEVDSLRQVQAALRDELRVLKDSLQFFDDIDSGQYHRDMNRLRTEVNRLQYDLAVSQDGGLAVATLLVDDLFEPASATLTERGRARLDEVAAKLQEAHATRPVQVEGHSDSVPVGPSIKDRYPSNWELSAARAASVARYLIEQHEMPEARLALAAFGASRPAAPNTTAEGRRLNRRIRISVLPAAE